MANDETTLAAVVDLNIAAALLGLTTTQLYTLHIRREAPVPVLSVAGQLRVTKAALAAHLGLSGAALQALAAPLELASADRAAIAKRAKDLKTTIGLVAYIDRLEARIVALEARIVALERERPRGGS